MKLLNEIQQKLKAPKAQYNQFGDYKYRNVSDILAAVKPLLGSGTLILSNKMIVVGDKRYVEATATLTDGIESVSATAHAREDDIRKKMNPEQLTGAASSYARKYALDGLFATDDMPDADATNQHENNGKEQTVSIDAILLKAFNEFIKNKPETKGFHFDIASFKKAVYAQAKKQVKAADRTGFAWTEESIKPFVAKVTMKEILVQDAPSD